MNNDTCSLEGCATAAKTRGWCTRHYQQHISGRPFTFPQQINCSVCGKLVETPRANVRYCSGQCREQAKYLRVRNDPDRWAAYLAKERDQYTPKRQDPKPRRYCELEGCENLVHSMNMCKKHYRRSRKRQGLDRAPSDAWSERRRSNYHARRARLRGASDSEKVTIAAIIERDGTNCSACGAPVDLELKWPHIMSKSIDHTLALSRGGSHTLANTTMMHFTCNSSKGAREHLTTSQRVA